MQNRTRELWSEALRLGSQEYGECSMRTQSDRPASNTPLMVMAKAPRHWVDETNYKGMLHDLLEYGGGLHLSDNQSMKAFMHACVSGDTRCY